MTFRLHLLLAALALPLAAAEPASGSPGSEPVALLKTSQLHVARNGAEVVVSWDIPADLAIKGIDVYRNTRDQASGRSRVDFVRPAPAVLRDKVPDAALTYWYWLKIVLVTGETVNIGPVKTPEASVWTP